MKLSNEKISSLIRDLWSFYLEDIKSNMPVYFCFTKAQIREVLIRNNLISSDYLNDFCNISKTFLKIEGGQISILENVYQPVWGKCSPTILLIALQVIAVELMDRDDHGIGADAYFPRLRKLLGVERDLEGRNPFKELEFLNLWNRFEFEVVSLGGNTKTITFQEGFGRKDKNRNFPISQALLSQSELLSVVALIYQNQGELPRVADLPLIITKLRSDLPARVREKFDRQFQRLKIIDQIFSFSKKVEIDKLKMVNSSELRSARDEDKVLKAFFDGFIEEKIFFEAYLKSGEKLDDQFTNVNSIVQNTMLILGRESADSFFWTSDITADLVDFEDFLIVYDESKIAAVNYFTSNYITAEFKSDYVECDISNIKVLKLKREDVTKNCLIKNGKEVRYNLEKLPDFISLNGGISLGANRYLISFPIFSISYKGTLVSNSESASLNGLEMRLVDLISKVNSSQLNEEFSIEFNGSRKIFKFVSEKQSSQEKKFGYEIKNMRINPVKTEVTNSNSKIFGFRFINSELREKIKSPKHHILLLNIIHLQDGIELTEDQKRMVLDSIESLNIKNHLKLLMKRNIETIGRVPAHFSSFF